MIGALLFPLQASIPDIISEEEDMCLGLQYLGPVDPLHHSFRLVDLLGLQSIRQLDDGQ